MKIAIAGATGKTGGALTTRMLDRGHKVRALVHNAGRAQHLAQRGAEIVAFDLSDEDSTCAALAGMEGVYYCSPLAAGHEDSFSVERTWGRHFLAGATAAGVEHVVLLSIQGPETAPGVKMLETKRQLERDLAASDLPHTVLRANTFMDNPESYAHDELLAGKFSMPLSPTALVQPVAVCDIAEVAARAFDSGPKNCFFNVLGPDPLTLPEMTQIIGRALGRPIEYVELSDEEFVARFGMFVGPSLAQGLAAIYRLWEREGAVGDTAPLRQEFGISLTSCEDYARGLAKTWKSKGLM